MKIVKAEETMTARERVRRTFNFEKTDRVTIGYEANGLIHKKLLTALDVNEDGLREALGIDYCGVWAPYKGEPLFTEIPERKVNPLDGYRMRWVENQSGGGYCRFSN